MSDVRIVRPHSVPLAELKRRMQTLAEEVEREKGYTWKWNGDAIDFVASGRKGRVVATANDLTVEVGDVPWIAKGMVEEKIDEKLRGLLSPPNEEKKPMADETLTPSQMQELRDRAQQQARTFREQNPPDVTNAERMEEAASMWQRRLDEVNAPPPGYNQVGKDAQAEGKKILASQAAADAAKAGGAVGIFERAGVALPGAAGAKGKSAPAPAPAAAPAASAVETASTGWWNWRPGWGSLAIAVGVVAGVALGRR